MFGRQLRACSLLLCVLVLGACFAAGEDRPESSGATFRFVHISDAHVRPGKTAQQLRRALADIASLEPLPDFVIDTGDITELGSREEIRLYKAIIDQSTVPVYAVPGNHDSRWSGVGKETFREYIGPPYRSFDHGGIHFVLLDSSLLLEQYGHFDPGQLDWLRGDLAPLAEDRPVVAAFHHPVAIDRTFIDNEWELLQVLAQHNTILALEGHIHSIRNWRVNGTDHVASGAVMSSESVYGIFDVSPDGVRCLVRNIDRRTEGERLRRDLRNQDACLVGRLLAPGNVSISDREIKLEAPASSEFGLGEITVSVNGGSPAAAEREGNTWTLPINAGAFPAGLSTVVVTAVLQNGERLARSFEWKSPGYDEVVCSAVATNGAIQSWPSVANGRVYFGSNDGIIRCHTAGNLDPVWAFPTGAEILAMPVADGDTVFVGSCDGNMYALDAASGEENWRFEAGESIYSTVAVDEDRVYFGCGDNNIYSLARETGEIVWEFECDSFTKNRPVLVEDRLYFGNWDRWVRCLDRRTGDLLWAEEVARHPLFPCATSNPLPVNSALIVATHDYNVRALSLDTGREIWFHEKTDTAKPSYSSPVLFGDTVIFGSITGHILGLDVKTGEEVFNTKVSESGDALFDSSPCLVGNRFYCGSVGGYVYGADARSGGITWRFRLSPAFIFSTPAWDGERLYVGSMDGRLYALALPGE